MHPGASDLLYELLSFFKKPEYGAKGVGTDVSLRIALELEEKIQQEDEFSEHHDQNMENAELRLNEKVASGDARKCAKREAKGRGCH